MIGKKKAFTLVEMLIVVVIIGILAAALVPRLTGAQAAARDSARKSDLNQISTALIMYSDQRGEFPFSGNDANCAVDIGPNLQANLPEVPVDPQAQSVAYGTQSGGCAGGSYAYAPILNRGSEQSAFVLISNQETFYNNMNYVLTGEVASDDDFALWEDDWNGENPTETPEALTSHVDYVDFVNTLCRNGVGDEEVEPGDSEYGTRCQARERDRGVWVVTNG